MVNFSDCCSLIDFLPEEIDGVPKKELIYLIFLSNKIFYDGRNLFFGEKKGDIFFLFYVQGNFSVFFDIFNYLIFRGIKIVKFNVFNERKEKIYRKLFFAEKTEKNNEFTIDFEKKENIILKRIEKIAKIGGFNYD